MGGVRFSAVYMHPPHAQRYCPLIAPLITCASLPRLLRIFSRFRVRRLGSHKPGKKLENRTALGARPLPSERRFARQLPVGRRLGRIRSFRPRTTKADPLYFSLAMEAGKTLVVVVVAFLISSAAAGRKDVLDTENAEPGAFREKRCKETF